MEKFKIRSTWKEPPAPMGPPPFKEGEYFYGKPVQATRFFDQLSYIGDTFVGTFVIETTEGLMLIDSCYDQQQDIDTIENGLRSLGLDPASIRKILVTHGHIDHYGPGKYFQEKYGTEHYMSRLDYELCSTLTEKDEDRINYPFPPIGYEIKNFIEDGMDITLGDTTVHAIVTPGHTPACMSFFFEVTDEGVPHTAAVWGGNGGPLPCSPDLEKRLYWTEKWVESAKYFASESEKRNVEVPLQVHFGGTVNGFERLAICRKPSPHTPNPFVFTREACREYERGIIKKAEDLKKSLESKSASK